MLLKMISIDGEFYKVGGKFSEAPKPTIGISYIYDDLVLPYFGVVDNVDNMTIPGIYKQEQDEMMHVPGKITYTLKNEHVVLPKKKERDKYSIDEIKEVSLQDMLSDGDIKTQVVFETGMNADVYVPMIQPGDDLGMRVLKYILGKKGIELKNYDHRFDKPYSRTNTKRMIDVGGTLKLTKLEELADIFDFGFVVGIYDKDGEIPNPITKDEIKKLYLLNYGKGLPIDEYEIVNIENED